MCKSFPLIGLQGFCFEFYRWLTKQDIERQLCHGRHLCEILWICLCKLHIQYGHLQVLKVYHMHNIPLMKKCSIHRVTLRVIKSAFQPRRWNAEIHASCVLRKILFRPTNYRQTKRFTRMGKEIDEVCLLTQPRSHLAVSQHVIVFLRSVWSLTLQLSMNCELAPLSNRDVTGTQASPGSFFKAKERTWERGWNGPCELEGLSLRGNADKKDGVASSEDIS